MKYLIANWKSYKTATEVRAWATEFSVFFQEFSDLHRSALQIVLLPSFLHLPLLNNQVPDLTLGVQTLSPFASGAYTGAVSASMVTEYAKYSLLGHTERRHFFGETDQIVANQAIQALEVGLTPILAVDDHNWSSQLSQLSAEQLANCLVMYEPPSAISTTGGHASDIETVRAAAKLIQQNYKVKGVLYGGSVTAQNVVTYMREADLAGVVVGAASLNAQTFVQLVRNAMV